MTHSFVHLSHGPLDPDFFAKAESICIAFPSPVSEAERRAGALAARLGGEG